MQIPLAGWGLVIERASKQLRRKFAERSVLFERRQRGKGEIKLELPLRRLQEGKIGVRLRGGFSSLTHSSDLRGEKTGSRQAAARQHVPEQLQEDCTVISRTPTYTLGRATTMLSKTTRACSIWTLASISAAGWVDLDS